MCGICEAHEEHQDILQPVAQGLMIGEKYSLTVEIVAWALQHAYSQGQSGKDLDLEAAMSFGVDEWVK